MPIIKWSKLGPRWPFDDEAWGSLVPWSGLEESESGLDMYETEDSVIVEAMVPGIPEDKVEVSLEGNMISIRASMEDTQEKKEKKKVVYKSSMQRAFGYSTSLPRSVDTEKAVAEISDGVVKITIPKVAAEKTKRLTVKKKS